MCPKRSKAEQVDTPSEAPNSTEKFPSWPPSVVRLAGTWSDFPDLEEIREGLGEDLRRELLVPLVVERERT